MDDRPPPARVAPVRAPPPFRSGPIVALVVAGLALAVLKPWGADDRSSPVPETLPRPAPTAASSPRGPAAVPGSPVPTDQPASLRQCFGLRGWRIYAIKQAADDRIRTWQAIEPVAAADPLARSIPVVRVSGARVLAVGFCAPVFAAGPAPIRTVDAWRVGDTPVAEPVRVEPMRTLAPPDPDEGRLWFPPRVGGRRPDRWLPGRYVFAVRRVGSARDAWFAIDVADPGPPR